MSARRTLRKLRDKARLVLRGWRYRTITGYLDIDGWLKIGEATRLFDLARGLPGEAPTVVEIGSWLGKSSVVLAKALADRPGATLYCIDPFNAAGDAESRDNYAARSAGLDGTLEERFRSNLRRNGVGGNVIVRKGYSHEFAGTHAEPIDLLFIDGNHEHAAVERDYLDWSPHVRPGGWLCFHDVGRSAAPGPLRVIQERVLGKPEWVEASQVNSLFCTRKAPLVGQAGARARAAP